MDCGADHERESQETGFDKEPSLRVQGLEGLREESVAGTLFASPRFLLKA